MSNFDSLFNKKSAVELRKFILEKTPAKYKKNNNTLNDEGIKWNANKMTLMNEHFVHMLCPYHSIFNKDYSSYQAFENDIINIGGSLTGGVVSSSAPKFSIQSSKEMIINKLLEIGDREKDNIHTDNRSLLLQLDNLKTKELELIEVDDDTVKQSDTVKKKQKEINNKIYMDVLKILFDFHKILYQFDSESNFPSYPDEEEVNPIEYITNTLREIKDDDKTLTNSEAIEIKSNYDEQIKSMNIEKLVKYTPTSSTSTTTITSIYKKDIINELKSDISTLLSVLDNKFGKLNFN